MCLKYSKYSPLSTFPEKNHQNLFHQIVLTFVRGIDKYELNALKCAFLNCSLAIPCSEYNTHISYNLLEVHCEHFKLICFYFRLNYVFLKSRIVDTLAINALATRGQ